MAALVVGDDAEAAAQRADLVEPHPLAAGETVQQNNRRPIANIADGNSQIADLDFDPCRFAYALMEIRWFG